MQSIIDTINSSKKGSGKSSMGLQIENIVDEYTTASIKASTLPYNFYFGAAVVLNGEIHILGGRSSETKHYKYDGASWTSESTLPCTFENYSAVVYKNDIHILCRPKHYKYDSIKKSWTEVSTLPFQTSYFSAVVLNNEIHILGGSSNNNGTGHYKYDGISWTEVSTLPYSLIGCNKVVVFNNEIHIFGQGTQHYKYDGDSWTEVSTLPYSLGSGVAIVLNNEIHILGGSGDDNVNHYRYNGNSWVNISALPYGFCYSPAVVLNGNMHILGTYQNPYYNYHSIVKNDVRYISVLLPKGTHILLPENMNIKHVSDNAIISEKNVVEVSETGIVELIAEFTDIDDMQNFLTFY